MIMSVRPTQDALVALVDRIRSLRREDMDLADAGNPEADDARGRRQLEEAGRKFERTAGLLADDMAALLGAPGDPRVELKSQEARLRAAARSEERQDTIGIVLAPLIWAAFWLVGAVTAYLYMTDVQRIPSTTGVVLGAAGWGLVIGLIYAVLAIAAVFAVAVLITRIGKNRGQP